MSVHGKKEGKKGKWRDYSWDSVFNKETMTGRSKGKKSRIGVDAKSTGILFPISSFQLLLCPTFSWPREHNSDNLTDDKWLFRNLSISE